MSVLQHELPGPLTCITRTDRWARIMRTGALWQRLAAARSPSSLFHKFASQQSNRQFGHAKEGVIPCRLNNSKNNIMINLLRKTVQYETIEQKLYNTLYNRATVTTQDCSTEQPSRTQILVDCLIYSGSKRYGTVPLYSTDNNLTQDRVAFLSIPFSSPSID